MADEKKVKKDSAEGKAKKPAATTVKAAGRPAPKKTAATKVAGKDSADKAGAKGKDKGNGSKDERCDCPRPYGPLRTEPIGKLRWTPRFKA